MALLVQRKAIDTSFDLTPLIDVVFQLLIFLMISSQFKKPETVLELPLGKSSSAVVNQEPEIPSISLEKSGQISLDGEPHSAEQLSQAIKARAAQGATQARLRGDRGASYGEFVELMDLVRSAGIRNLQIIRKAQAGKAESSSAAQ